MNLITGFLDHAITVRDLLCACGVFAVLLFIVAVLVHPPYVTRRQRRRRLATEHLRNPVYGIPKDDR